MAWDKRGHSLLGGEGFRRCAGIGQGGRAFWNLCRLRSLRVAVTPPLPGSASPTLDTMWA